MHFQIKFERLQVLQKNLQKKMHVFDPYGVNNLSFAMKPKLNDFRQLYPTFKKRIMKIGAEEVP